MIKFTSVYCKNEKGNWLEINNEYAKYFCPKHDSKNDAIFILESEASL